MNIRVAIIEDETAIREGISYLIDSSHGFECKHKYESVETAVNDLGRHSPDVVLVDIHLPGMNGVAGLLTLKSICPSAQFMMFTSFEDIDTIFNSLKAGATGYLIKSTAPGKILEAIQDIHQGGSPMSGSIARKVIEYFTPSKANTQLELLSEREQEIIVLLSKGFRYKEIADKLNVSVETVRTHIRNTYRKLEVNSKVDALNKVFPK